MSAYTITITPDDEGRATTILRVDATSGVDRIAELLVRPAAGVSLTSNQLPAVDLELLLRAVNPSPTAPAIGAPAAALTPTAASGHTEPDVSPEPVPADDSNADGPAAPVAEARVPRARKATTSRRATKAATTTGERAASEAAATDAIEDENAKTRTRRAAKPGRSKTTDVDSAPASGRNYRRAPQDLASVVQQTGSATAIADHYNVPRHTAQAWLRTLKRRELAAAG